MKKFTLIAAVLISLGTVLPLWGQGLVGKPAIEIAADGWLNTKSLTLKELRGKVVVLEFWATWYKLCKVTIPHLNELQAKYKDKGVVIIAISDETMDKVKPFAEKMKMAYAVGVSDGATAKKYGVIGLPHAFLIDREGVIRWSGHSMAIDKALEKEVEKSPAAALASKKPSVKTPPAAKPKAKEPVEELFILPDLGWRDPFIDPRESKRPIDPDDPIGDENIDEELIKLWKNEKALILVESIIGTESPVPGENDFMATVSGRRVRVGDIVTGEKLKFQVDKITKDAVHLHCASKEEKYRKLRNIKVEKRLNI